MVNMLQNISQKRENKKITKLDIRHACVGACLAIYPAKSMYSPETDNHLYGHFPLGFIHCVKGENGKARVLWYLNFYVDAANPAAVAALSSNNSSMSAVNCTSSALPPASIYKDLKIKDGEIKILVQCSCFYNNSATLWKFSDGRTCMDVSPREAFGFMVLPVKTSASNTGNSSVYVYYNPVVIFTPKPGLFDETPPA
jgi:hypothetical protein